MAQVSRKSKRQCYISDYFNPAASNELSATPKSSTFPELPPEVQSSLLSVGMRVRKAVSTRQAAGAGFCTHGKRELMPLAESHDTCHPSRHTVPSFYQRDLCRIDHPASSQESTSSMDTSDSELASQQDTSKRKRDDDDIGEEIDGEQNLEEKPGVVLESIAQDYGQWINSRMRLIPRPRSTLWRQREVTVSLDPDFEDAAFLRPRSPQQYNDKYMFGS